MKVLGAESELLQYRAKLLEGQALSVSRVHRIPKTIHGHKRISLTDRVFRT
jgi:hypothetical protein